MTRRISGNPSEDRVEGPVGLDFVGRHGESLIPSGFFQDPSEIVAQWGGEPFAGISGVALGVLQQDGLGSEINPALCNSGLIEPAPRLDQDLKDGRHPRLCFLEKSSGLLDLLVGQVGFLLGLSKGDPCQSDHVPVKQLAAHSLLKKEAQVLYLKAGGVVSDTLPFAPSHVELGVVVGDFLGVSDPIFREEGIQGFPHLDITPLARLATVVTTGEIRHPRGQIPADVTTGLGFDGGTAGGLLPGLQRLLRVIMTELQVLFLPPLRLRVAEPEIPERTPRNLTQIGHAKEFPIVPHEGSIFLPTLAG